MFIVYVLYSDLHDRIYTGQTNDVDKRLARHNFGQVQSTKPYRPGRIIYCERFINRSEAMKREKFFKCGKGRDFLRRIKGVILATK